MIHKTITLGLFSLLSSPFIFANDVRSQLRQIVTNNDANSEYVRQRFFQWVKVPFNSNDTKKRHLLLVIVMHKTFLTAY